MHLKLDGGMLISGVHEAWAEVALTSLPPFPPRLALVDGYNRRDGQNTPASIREAIPKRQVFSDG
jgi:hypothetical protein